MEEIQGKLANQICILGDCINSMEYQIEFRKGADFRKQLSRDLKDMRQAIDEVQKLKEQLKNL